MALFHNLGVKLRSCLCDVPRYVSAQLLVLTRGHPSLLALTGSAPRRNPIPLSCGIVLDLVENCLFLNWKLTPVPIYQKPIYGWALAKLLLSTFHERPVRRLLLVALYLGQPRLSLN